MSSTITPAASTGSSSSSGSTSAPTSISTSTRASSSGSSSSLSFDSSRVGWSVYSWGSAPTASTSSSHHSGSLLSSKPAVAGICAGIAVVCILVSAFLFYRVQGRKAKQRALLAGSRESTPSRRAPTPFRLGARKHTSQTKEQQPTHAHSRSITPRSFQQALSRNTSTSTQFLAPQNARLINTPSSHDMIRSSPSASSQPLSMHDATTPGTSEYTTKSTGPLRSLETSSTRSSAQISLIGSNRTSAKDPFTYPPQDLLGARPLPTIPIQIPAHPPPSYDGQSQHLPPSLLSRDNSLATSSSRSLATATVHNLGDAQLIGAEKLGRSSYGSHPGYAPPSDTVYDEIVHFDEKASFRAPRPSTEHRSGLDTLGEATEMKVITSSNVPQDVTPEQDQEQDPFENARYEIPGWLNSDPFPTNGRLKHSASQPSLVSRPRSTAPSSCVLPSDSSIRTLTPEPPSSPPLPPLPITPMGAASIRSYTTQTTQTTNLTGETVVYHRTIEGAGPAVEDLIVMHGAERPGWARAISSLSGYSNASTSSTLTPAPNRSRNRFPFDSFDPNEGNPLGRNSTIQIQTPPPKRPSALPLQQPVQSLDSYRSTFLSMSPLTASLPGRGLSRAYTTVDRQRPRPLDINTAGHSRSNSYTTSPGLNRSLSSVHISSRALTGREDIGLRSSVLYSGISNSQPNLFSGGGREPSMMHSSNVFPAEQESIRSISPEIGWMGAEGEDEHDDQQSKTPKATSVAENHSTVRLRGAGAGIDAALVANRQSRFSVGEDGILWGRLTSALEAQDEPKTQNSALNV